MSEPRLSAVTSLDLPCLVSLPEGKASSADLPALGNEAE